MLGIIMKPLIQAVLLLSLSIIGSVAHADVILKANDEVQGTWKLETTKNSPKDKHPITREDTWEFKGDKVTIFHIPREGTYYDQPPVPFEVVEGKLKIAVLGGSRFDLFTVVEKDDHNMTLKGKFGDYSYFVKK